MRSLAYIPILALAGFAPATQAATSPQIGTTAVTKNSVTGLLGKEQRTLKRGDGVFQNETVTTGKEGGAQLLFRDETALTMGPDSRVILDKLIYDPDKKTGEMTIRAVTGAFRFVTGSGPKPGYKVETPVGTIGVRGTIFNVLIRQIGPVTQVVLGVDEGGAYICRATKCVDLVPGTYVVVTGAQMGNSESKYNKECGTGGGPHCYVNDGGNTLYIDFLGLGRFFNELTPAAGPNFPNNPPPPPGNGPPPPPGNGPPPVPGNGPPPPPPPVNNGSTPPILTGAGAVPPGLQNQLNSGSLPPGLQDRCSGAGCTAPGNNSAPPGKLNAPGQLKK